MKQSPEELAIFGGTPAFSEPLYVGRPNIGNRQRFMERVHDILDRKWLSNNGPYVQDFERRISHLLGVRHCIAVCNGTEALEIAIRATGLTGEVVVPSFTFIATAHALKWQGITPVFCDIDPRTHNLDPSRVEEKITPRTTGIVGVHLWGRPCDVDRLTEMAQRRGLKLLFDAAHAVGCSYKGRMIGNFGNAEIFSFHATKCLNTFEGGAVVTNDDETASRARMMRDFGINDHDEVVSVGTNAKMSEVSAAMGLTSLESLNEVIAVNCGNYTRYKTLLGGIRGISLLTYEETESCNYQCIVLEIDERIVGLSRDQLLEILQAEKVFARRYFYPGCHRLEPYRSCYPQAGLELPVTDYISNRVISLPTGTAIGEEQIKAICDLIRFAVENAVAVRSRLEMYHSVS